jgi:hypothetical protein
MTNILQGAGGSRKVLGIQSAARTQNQIMAAKKASFSQTDQGFTFPSDLSADYCFHMAMVEFEYNSAGQGGTSSGVPDQISGGSGTQGKAKTEKVGRNYFLPVPTSMKDSQGLDYSTIELGAVVGKLAGEVDKIASEMGAAAGAEEVGKVLGRSVGAGAKAISNANKADAAAIIQAALGTNAFPRLAGIGGAVLGQVPNPHVTSFFKGVKLKNYQFDWQLWPQSAEETLTIEKMVNSLKSDILPTRGTGNLGLSLKYPKEAHCRIHTLNGNQTHLNFKPAFVTDVSIDYTPQGPAFLENGHPAGIGLSISLQETSIWLSNDYPDSGLNLSSGAKSTARIADTTGLQGTFT